MKRQVMVIADALVDESIGVLFKTCKKLMFEVTTISDADLAVHELRESLHTDSERRYDIVFIDINFIWQFLRIRRLGFPGKIVALGRGNSL